MSLKKYYLTYKVQHETGFYYIGYHSTNVLDDGYMGSGVILKEFMKILPQGWTKTILCTYPTSKEAKAGEKRSVGTRWKYDPFCLNICPGGGVHEKALVLYYKQKLINLFMLNLLKNEKSQRT